MTTMADNMKTNVGEKTNTHEHLTTEPTLATLASTNIVCTKAIINKNSAIDNRFINIGIN